MQKRRRARHTLLRDATRDDDEPGPGRRRSRAAQSEPCPVCRQTIAGDPDVFAAHVDACLAHASLIEQQQQQASTSYARDGSEVGDEDLDADVDVDVDGEGEEEDPWEEIEGPDGTSRVRLRASGASARALGFDVRDQAVADVDIDVDIDGDDEVVFGTAQFTEADVDGAEVPETVLEEADIEAAVSSARRRGDDKALVAALESKIKFLVREHCSQCGSLLQLLVQQTSPAAVAANSNTSCRICLDAYVEPTVSTGCWHACCRQCWLRCIGSTKVCPICKRITAAQDLRRVFL